MVRMESNGKGLKEEACPVQVAKLVGTSFCTPNVEGLIPGQGTYLDCRFHPWPGHLWEATN